VRYQCTHCEALEILSVFVLFSNETNTIRKSQFPDHFRKSKHKGVIRVILSAIEF
jgi:hypothetical protein